MPISRATSDYRGQLRRRQVQKVTQNSRLAFGRRGRAGLIVGFNPIFRRAAGAGGAPGLMIAVLAVFFGIREVFCAQIRHRQLPFGVLDSENGRARRRQPGGGRRQAAHLHAPARRFIRQPRPGLAA